VRSSPSIVSIGGSVKRPRSASVAIGVPSTIVSVSAEKNSGSIAVTRRAEPAACSALRSTPPAPSRKIADTAIPASCARVEASACSSKVEPLAMRFNVTSSPLSGPI
jgi:hypothetical protein